MPILRGCFIGVDRYQDESVRDLTGAVRDARALHALFSDSVPGLQATLLTDEHGTVAAVRSALTDTLSLAGPEDTVILSFAGHGSPSHRLLACDTRKEGFARTSISMDEVAEQFRNSAAKYILLLLDCCFSGGAGARVFDEAPVLRDNTDPYGGFSGKGRMLFAAARADQPALEDPLTRHGIFTKAFLEVIQSQEGNADLSTLTTLVMDLVRAEAQRRGYEQTPVGFNLIEGGMRLPRLRPGPRFHEAFPDICGTRVDPDTAELQSFGLPASITSAWKGQYPQLNDLQLAAVNDYRVLDGQSLLVVAPTSSGKTFIGEMAAARAIVEGRKAVFLLPYRALVGEKFDQFDSLYGRELGMRVIRCCGDHTDDNGRFLYGKYDLAVFTYEMFLSLIVSNPMAVTQIGLVVLDEAQFITDPTRGISVELLLTLLVAGRPRGVCPQVVALSAVIGNINHFDAWLGCKALVTYNRPVKLIEGVIDRSGTFQFVDENGTVDTTQLIPAHAVSQRRDKPSAQDVIVPLAQKLVGEGKKLIIFRNKKGSAQGCAKYLSADLGLPEAEDTLRQLPSVDLSSASAALRDSLRGGTAFHTANLDRDERAVVERAFRDPKGEVQVLAATTTVAAGINTPASTVIIAEQEFKGENGRPFTVAEYKNMAGRAGRWGFQEQGMSIIYADSSFQREQLFERYVRGEIEPISSSFKDRDVHTWVLRLLAQVHELPRKDVAKLLANTYGGYLLSRSQPDRAASMRSDIEGVIEEMLKYGLLEQERDEVWLTLLGRACGGSSLTYSSALRLIEVLRTFPPDFTTPERLMALVQGLPEMDAVSTPVSRGQAEHSFVSQAIGRYGYEVARHLEWRAREITDHVRRCKRACVLGDWIDGIPLETIERRYTINGFSPIGPGEIRGFADTTRFHLRSAANILRVIYLETGPNDEFDVLLKRLEVGIPAGAVGLLALPGTLLRGEYIALYDAGFGDPDAVRLGTVDRLTPLLGKVRAERLMAALA